MLSVSRFIKKKEVPLNLLLKAQKGGAVLDFIFVVFMFLIAVFFLLKNYSNTVGSIGSFK